MYKLYIFKAKCLRVSLHLGHTVEKQLKNV